MAKLLAPAERMSVAVRFQTGSSEYFQTQGSSTTEGQLAEAQRWALMEAEAISLGMACIEAAFSLTLGGGVGSIIRGAGLLGYGGREVRRIVWLHIRTIGIGGPLSEFELDVRIWRFPATRATRRQ